MPRGLIGQTAGVPRTKGPHGIRQFLEIPPYFEERNYTYSGISKDSGGTPVGSAQMRLFNTTAGQIWVQEQYMVSDAATGAYSFTCDKTQTYVVAGYKVGGPDIKGITINQAPT